MIGKLLVSCAISLFFLVFFLFFNDLKNLNKKELDIKLVQKSSIVENLEHKEYEVESGNSIYSIARKFKILKWQLRKANGFDEEVIIHPGDILRIPKIKWVEYEGIASWYGPGFHGKRMANGEKYDQHEVLVAHRHYPLGLKIRVVNLNNGKFIDTVVKDRGPYIDGRELDVSYAGAKKLGFVNQGTTMVRMIPLS